MYSVVIDAICTDIFLPILAIVYTHCDDGSMFGGLKILLGLAVVRPVLNFGIAFSYLDTLRIFMESWIVP